MGPAGKTAAGLVGWWKLDDGSSGTSPTTAADSSGLLENSESDVVAALRVLRASFKNPPLTAATLLAEMSRQGLAASADALAAFADSL